LGELDKSNKNVKSLLRVRKEILVEEYLYSKRALDLLQAENNWLKGIFDLHQECIEERGENGDVITLTDEFKESIEEIKEYYNQHVNNPDFYSE
jgi:hypothetical protein